MVNESTLKLFHKAAKELPAYKKFLKENKFDPNRVVTVNDLRSVPLTSKKTYLVPNDPLELIWKADLESTLLYCSTSGSTGEPYYFPRNSKLSEQYSTVIEEFLNNSSYGKGRVLVLNGFGMGVWIGGILTHSAFEIAGSRMNAPLAILPTGYNKTEIFKALRKLSPQFDQTILIGYPPFVKEVVDGAEEEGVELNKLNVRFLFAAEAFTETFRNYICEKAGVGNPVLDTLNIYGTADIGAMAFETPLSIFIRRLSLQDPYLFKDIFGQVGITPTLAQFNPKYMQFEEVNGSVVLSGDSALPLIRYSVGDRGGVTDYQTISQKVQNYGINLSAELQKAGLNNKLNIDYPFVYVYERADLAVTLQGIIIYPEYIKEGLLQDEMNTMFTERFTMSTKSDIYHNQFLQVNIELQKGLEPNKDLGQKAQKAIKESLVKRSSEFAEVSRRRKTNQLLDIVLWPNGHTRYFAPNTKQKWVEK